MNITAYVTDGGTLVLGRGGHAPSPPALVANVVLRLILCPLAMLLTIVPLRMLWKNGEFPAVVFVLCTNIMALFVFVNAALWHNQDFDSWWLGYGWCDLQAYVGYSLTTAYSACVCAIMQRLSSQLGLTRVSSLSPRERRKQLIVQAAIIFPVPVLQAVITIFVQGIRYAIIPGGGCTVQYNATALVLVFFVLPPTIFTIIACFHTCTSFFFFLLPFLASFSCFLSLLCCSHQLTRPVQVYRKFREVDVDCRAALAGTNTVAFLRRQRARRKLYFMVMCILIPYTPLTITFCAVNIIGGWPWNYPADFYSNHFGGPNPWNTIIVFAYSDVSFMTNNLGWIPVVSLFIAFVFFGTSKEAINVHRQYMLALGLGRLFPGLHTPYNPDRSGATSLFDSTASTAATQLTVLTSTWYVSYTPRSCRDSNRLNNADPTVTREKARLCRRAILCRQHRRACPLRPARRITFWQPLHLATTAISCCARRRPPSAGGAPRHSPSRSALDTPMPARTMSWNAA